MIVATRCSVLTLLGALCLTACAGSASRIIANRAPDFSLANYQTFGYLQPLSTDRGAVRTIISTQLMAATTREMEIAGLSLVETDPDLLVNFIISTRETLETRPSTAIGIHHGRGRYGTWGGYTWGVSTTEIVQRTEGTLAVDVIDRERNMLVWEAAATGRVTDRVRENPGPVIDQAIADMFAEFP